MTIGLTGAGDVTQPRVLALAWICGVLLGLIGLGLHGGSVDRQLFTSLHELGRLAPGFWSALSVLGTGLAVLVAAASVGPRGARVLSQLLLVIIVGGLLVQVLKSLFGLPRPLAVLGAQDVQVIGIALFSRSMPSGHAACAAAVAFIVAAHAVREGWRPGLVLVLSATLAALVALSRVAVGAHWPSDLLAGMGVGAGAAATVTSSLLLQRWTAWLEQRMLRRAGSRVMAALTVLLATALWQADSEYPLADWVPALLGLMALVGALAWWSLWPGPGRTAPLVEALLAPFRQAWSQRSATPRSRVVWTVVVSAVVVGVLVAWVPSPAALAQRMQWVPTWIWLLSALCLLASYGLRALRLRDEWSSRLQLGWRECMHLTLLHSAAINLLPLRAGEAGYPWLLRQRHGVAVGDSVSSLAWLRAQDTLMLLALCWVCFGPGLMPAQRAALALAALVLAAWGGRRLARRLLQAGPEAAARIWAPLRVPLTVLLQALERAPVRVWLWTGLNWLVKIGGAALLIGSLLGLKPTDVVLAFGSAALGEAAGALPLQAPSGFGAYEGGVWLGTTLQGATLAAPDVLGAALLAHLFALLVGVAAALVSQWWQVVRSSAPPAVINPASGSLP